MNAYTKVMDILSQDELDWKVLVFEIAKTNPGAVVRAAESLNMARPKPEWVTTAIAYIKAGEFIQAIKTVRSGTGWGLIESKKWCEDERDNLEIVRG